jgi:hypothetical protein
VIQQRYAEVEAAVVYGGTRALASRLMLGRHLQQTVDLQEDLAEKGGLSAL